MKVSVITTFYNDQKTLAKTIESIVSQLSTDMEYILIDDGSTDGSYDIAQQYKSTSVRVMSQGKLGRAKALNLGLKEARGEYIAIIDADDFAYPDRLNVQQTYLDRHQDVTLCASNATFVTYHGRTIGDTCFPCTHPEIQINLLKGAPFVHSTVMFRSKAAAKVGGYPQWCEKAIDINFYLKLLRANATFTLLPQPLTYYREYDFSWGKSDSQGIQFRCFFLGVLEHYLLSQKKGEGCEKQFNDKQFQFIFSKWFAKQRYLKKFEAKKRVKKGINSLKKGRFFVSIRELFGALMLDPMLFFYSGAGFEYPKDIVKFLKFASKRGWSFYAKK